MKLSIVIPAFNEEKLLPETLACLREGMNSLPGCEWELIVCDNNSTDRTAQIARDAGATVVFEPVNQIARARNAGAARAGGDWLLFLDADSLPTPGLLQDMAETIASGRYVGGGSLVTSPGMPPAAALILATWNRISRLCNWAAGSFIFCEAAAFREMGGFDETFYAAEEINFSRRLKRVARGRGLGFVILHRHPLLTSNRKTRLYSIRELFLFMLKAILSGGRALRRRDDCYVWYDGRR